IPRGTSAPSKPSIAPPRMVPVVTSGQKILTPATMRARGMTAHPTALARSVTDVGGLIQHTAPNGCSAGSSRRSTVRSVQEPRKNGASRAREKARWPQMAGASVREMPHPDVALERARLRYAQECLEGMRRKTASRVAAEHVLAANEADAEAVKWQLERRLDSLNDEAGSLCFGRIDAHDDARWYI